MPASECTCVPPIVRFLPASTHVSRASMCQCACVHACLPACLHACVCSCVSHASLPACVCLSVFPRESRAVDTESLCVVAGRAVWSLRLDLRVLDNEG